MDKNKEIVWQWNSDAFGTTKAKGQRTMSLRFPGQYEDKETGLFYNWHRYYNPTTGRYITSDPIGLNAGINTYAYVGGNPVSSYDLMGLADNRLTKFGVMQAILPAHTASISRYPIGGSMTSQIQYANYVNTNREFFVSNGYFGGQKLVDFAVNNGIIKPLANHISNDVMRGSEVPKINDESSGDGLSLSEIIDEATKPVDEEFLNMVCD